MEHSWRRAVNDAATGLAIHNVKRLPKRGESGFTLVEVLVAIVVLSITGLAAAQFAITAIRTSYAQQQRSAAIALGSDGIERMRAQIADHTSAPSSYYTDLLPGMGVDDVKKAHANLTAVGAITSQFSDLRLRPLRMPIRASTFSRCALPRQRRQTYYIYGEHRD